MDYNKQYDALQSCMKNINYDVALELLSDRNFVLNESAKIIELLGNELTQDNLKNRPDYFNFCEEQLLKMARSEDQQSVIFDFLDLINTDTCVITSSVLIAVTILEMTECPDRVCLEFFLTSIFDNLIKMDDNDLKDILPIIVKHLLKINKQFKKFHSVLYYFSRIAFLVLRANIDPVEFIDIFSNVIYDPYCLLEQEFDEIEEKTYLASFYYIYFKTGKIWGPKIYNPFYILEKCLNLAVCAFKNNIFGKPFAKLILSKFEDNEIPLRLLHKCHQEFVIEAADSSMYNEEPSIRKESIEILSLYMDKLCNEAQYVVFRFIFRTLDYSIKAELIIKMKSMLCLKLTSNQDLGYFQGIRLLEMLRLCCNIPNGSKCHVVDNKEYVLSVITVMYVLYAYNDIKLNMGEAFVDTANEFVRTVQNAIDYTNEEYIEEYRKLSNKNDKEDVPDHLKLTESEKKDLLLKFKTIVLVVQTNLNLLKDKLSNCNFAKVTNLGAFWLKETPMRLCNTNNDNSRIGRETIDENDDGSSDNYEQDIRSKILQSSLPYVPEHGWSRDTVAAGADKLGYPDTVHGLFNDPGAELALYFYSSSNDSLSRLLKDGTLKCSKENKAELVKFLSGTIKTRLLMLEPYLNQWPQAIALLSKPSNAPNALSNLMTLVDDICYHAGDRSIDTRWYTRRIGLATIYKSGELHLLQDRSQGYEDTWNFVRRAVDECVKLDTMLESNAQLAKDVVTASVSTAKNILGLSWNR